MEQGEPKIKVEYGTDVTLVTFTEEALFEEEQIKKLREFLEVVIEKNKDKKLILSFVNVRFTSSALLGLLVRVHKKVIELGGTLQLSNVDKSLRMVFEITQLTKVFDIS